MHRHHNSHKESREERSSGNGRRDERRSTDIERTAYQEHEIWRLNRKISQIEDLRNTEVRPLLDREVWAVRQVLDRQNEAVGQVKKNREKAIGQVKKRWSDELKPVHLSEESDIKAQRDKYDKSKDKLKKQHYKQIEHRDITKEYSKYILDQLRGGYDTSVSTIREKYQAEENRIFERYQPEIDRVWASYQPEMDRVWASYQPEIEQASVSYRGEINRIWDEHQSTIDNLTTQLNELQIISETPSRAQTPTPGGFNDVLRETSYQDQQYLEDLTNRIGGLDINAEAQRTSPPHRNNDFLRR